MADVNSPRIWRFLKRVAWFLKSVTVIFVYRKSLNRSPRLVTEAWLLFEARLILVHPHYSRQHVSPDNRVFCSMESTQTFRNQIHQFSQLLKPGLYLTTSCVCWSTTTSHPLVGRRHTLLTCSRLQQTFRHWRLEWRLHCLMHQQSIWRLGFFSRCSLSLESAAGWPEDRIVLNRSVQTPIENISV